MKCFGTVSSDEVRQKHIKYTPDNTMKMNKLAGELLQSYLNEKIKNPNFETYTEDEIWQMCYQPFT